MILVIMSDHYAGKSSSQLCDNKNTDELPRIKLDISRTTIYNILVSYLLIIH